MELRPAGERRRLNVNLRVWEGGWRVYVEGATWSVSCLPTDRWSAPRLRWTWRREPYPVDVASAAYECEIGPVRLVVERLRGA